MQIPAGGPNVPRRRRQPEVELVPITTLDEAEVARRADRPVLALVRSDAAPAPTLAAERCHLTAAQTGSPVFPGGSAVGSMAGPATGRFLADLQDWLGRPWE